MAARVFTRSVARATRLQASASIRCNSSATFNSIPETQVTTLSNGLRVATETTPNKTATIGLYIDAGSRFENAKNNGTAHFLEHMAFKGTANRSREQLELEVENMGAHLNAYTSREQTVYFAKCFASDLAQTTDILADILQNSNLDQAQIESERDVIIREMQEVNNQPEEVVFDHLHSIAYQGTSLGYTILGPEENVRSITQDDLKTYIAKNYTAPRIVLAAAGGVEHDAVVELAEKYFGQLSSENNAEVAPAALFTGAEIRDRDDTLPHAHVAMAVQGCSWSDPDYFPLMIANSLVGGWDRSFGGGENLSSPLAQECSSRQLAHKYMSFNTSYSDTGLWGIYAELDHDTIDDFVWETQQEWMRLCTSLSEASVNRAKSQLKSAMLFQLDGTTAVCDEIGRQMLNYGRRMPAAELNERINDVDVSTVKAAANKYLFDQSPAVAALGPIEQLPDYNRIRSGMLWLRV